MIPTASLPQPTRPLPSRQKQGGIVLFIAHIALIVLTLAALGFMRSIDTGKILAGNLAFNRASVAISDAGMEAARTVLANLDNSTLTNACALTATGASCLWLNGATMPSASVGTLTLIQCSGSPCTNGYFANVDPAFNYRTTDWTNAYQLSGLSAPQTTALVGYDVRYIIHRMCELTGDPQYAHCLTTDVIGGQNKGNVSYVNNQMQSNASNPVYRITVRVAGPRNSLSYIQIWMS